MGTFGGAGTKRPRRLPDFALREPVSYENHPLTPSAYRAIPGEPSIVVDFGSSALRAGFSTDSGSSPRLNFPPYVGRGRETGQRGLYSHVGYEALASSHRSAARSPFDGAIPNNATLVERLLDGVLMRLGLAEEDSIQHPFVVTEPPCQPNGVRAQFTEILFEAYKVPKACFGVDALFSYLYNGNISDGCGGIRFSRKSGIVVSCGYNTTHVLPVFGGRFHANGAKRINLGGNHMTTNLSRRLQLRHPDDSTQFTYTRCEALKHDVCYVSNDFDAELRRIRDDKEVFDSVSRLVEIPVTDGGPDKPGLSPEEQELAKQSRIERGKRLSDMMKERKRAKAAAGGNKKGSGSEVDASEYVTEEEAAPLLAALSKLREVEMISEAHDQGDEDLYYLARVKAGYETEESFEAAATELLRIVDEARERLGEAKAEQADALWTKKRQEDELLAVPDEELSAPGLKRKRLLRSQRGAAEARLRIKRQKEKALEAERQRAAELAREREENPEGYLDNLRKQRADVAERVKRRKAAKDAGSDRRSLAARQRMRLLAQHAGKQGAVEEAAGGGGGKRRRGPAKSKGEDDTFGMNDSDWDVYRDMRVREDVGEEESEDEAAKDEERLEQLRGEILDMMPDEEDPTLERPVGSALLYVPHPFPNEFPVVIERLSTPEALFQPSLLGYEQCGVAEAIEMVASSFPDPADRRNIVSEIFLTGGVAWTNGLAGRFRRELRSRFPEEWGDQVSAGVRRARDPSLDAWNGACLFASSGGSAFEKACISRKEYEEVGPDYMGEHGMANMHVPTPFVDPVEAERRKKLHSYRRPGGSLVR